MTEKQRYAEFLAQEFHDFMTEWHLHDQPYDDLMDADIYERYARVIREQSKWGYFDFRKNPQGNERPHFGPSSAGYSDREMYEKARKSKRFRAPSTENQRYWTGIGSVLGDYLQREILLAERHYEKVVGKKPKFRMKRKDNGDPMYEHFVKKMHEIEHDGEYFAYFGLPDGLLEYADEETGEVVTVNLEIKSEQSNWSKFKALDEPKPGHLAQTTAYADMYDTNYVIVAYILSYGRGWYEDFSRLKTFGRYISQEDILALRQRCSEAVKQAKAGTPPPVDLGQWKFFDYKEVVAKDLTEEELETLRTQAHRAQSSGLPAYMKRSYSEAIAEIEAIRSA